MEVFTLQNLVALLSLTGLEIVLGFDNIVIMSVMVARLDRDKQDGARRLGILLAMCMRICLLLSISWLMLLTNPLFELFNHSVSGKDLVMLIGGLFLIGKATFEIHENTEGEEHDEGKPRGAKRFWAVIVQIILLDLVFSLDSVITAVGVADHISVMIFAIIVSVVMMFFFAKGIGNFIHEHPTFKILALSFLVLVGVMLVAEGLGQHIEKGYIYFAMSFSLIVEFFNLRMRTKHLRAKRIKSPGEGE
ncbi:MAG: TerC family protein [Bdellovibrionota bacterium]